MTLVPISSQDLATTTRCPRVGHKIGPSFCKAIETPFAIVLTVSDDEITRFLMLEHTLAVAATARSL